jgi:hypothetical protein
MPKSTRARVQSGAAQLILTLIALLWTIAPTPALARQSDPPADPAPAETTQQDPTPADINSGSLTSGPDTANQIITIEAEQFGVGDIVRESDWCGLSLILSDPTSDKARNVAVRVAIKDDDGDTQYVTRTLALSMATRVRAWLYFRVPKQFQNGSVVTVSVHEIDANAPAPEDGNIQVGKQLSYARIACRQVLGGTNGSDPTMAMMGVIGRRTFRLDQYELRGPGGTLPTAHEPCEIVSGLTPESLPDSWVGLAPFEVILWTEGGPEQLEESRRQALREWVNRGGHLVVVLPPVGSTWFAAANPIADLMPSVKVRRIDDQSLEPYRNLLTDGGLTRDELPAKTVVQAFEALPDTPSNECIEVLSGPNGCVAARRLVGTGMVTVIGLDLGAGRLPTGLLAADAFWHRVLGKRFDIPTSEEAKNITSGGVFGGGGTFYADGYISPEIAKQRAAGVGVLLGLLVFAAYWFVAGPGGFGALKWKKMIHHAWVGFFAATLLFTFIAWAGATALRPRRVEAQHLTYLTHVYGQPVQSARVWFSALLPEYGDKAVSIGRKDADTQWRQALTGWSEPIGNARPTPFPDARGYAVDVRKLNIARVPARATIRQFQGDWLGGPTWTMPTPTDPSLAPRLTRLESTFALSGTLVHKLPAELTNVWVILVTGETTEARARTKLRLKATGVMPSNAYAWAYPGGRWQPGTTLDLADYAFKDDPTFEKFIGTITPSGGGIANLGVTVPSAVDPATPNYHTLAALFSMMPQPNWDKSIVNNASVATMHRLASQGLDLGKWFTQPCIIIIGHIEKGPTPVPITIDGDPCPTEGRTVVRWVYPLASAPPKFSRPAANTPAPLGGTAGDSTSNEPN